MNMSAGDLCLILFIPVTPNKQFYGFFGRRFSYFFRLKEHREERKY